MNRSWIYIFVGAILEVLWAIGFKHADSVLLWVATIVCLFVSLYLIVAASKKLPVGTVYAVFTGLGTAGTVLVEALLFAEPVKLPRLLMIAMLLGGVIGLKLTGGSSAPEEAK